MSLQDEARRGQWASEVLANEVYTEAYSLLEQEIITKWRDSSDPESRERLHLMLRMLAKVRSLVESTMESGKVASASLEMEQSRLERLGNVFKRRSAA